MRVYVATSLWVGEQEDCLQRCLDAWADSGFDVTFEIDANREVSFESGRLKAAVHVNPYEAYRSYYQTWHHRQRMISYKNDYDLFVYQENDMLITREHVENFLLWQTYVPDNWLIRFMSYVQESDENRTVYHTCGADGWDVMKHKDEWYLDLHARYWSFSMLTRQQLKRAVSLGAFSTSPKRISFGVSEDASAEPWLMGAFLPVVPVDAIDRFLVEHISGKYKKTSSRGLFFTEILNRTVERVRELESR